MISFKPIIIPGDRRKDGTWPVYIRVTLHGQSRRLHTTLVCRAEDLTKARKIKSADIISKGNALIARMREAVADLSPFTLEAWDVDRVVREIRTKMEGETFRLDFFAFGEKYAQTKTPATRQAYTGALNALERFLGGRQLDINDITRGMLLDFVAYVDAEPKWHKKGRFGEVSPTGRTKIPHGASSRHIAKLAHLYAQAKLRYNDEDSGRIVIPRSPFTTVPHKQPQSHGQKALPVEVIRQILRAETDSSLERVALDAFALSFLTMGANLADLYRAEPFSGGTWEYRRKKTESRRADHAEMKVVLQPETSGYIGRLQSRGDAKRWWLPALHAVAPRTAEAATALLNKGLGQWCAREGIPRFTFYAARHSWATIARRLGVEKATVDECLCHVGDYDVTDIYAEKAWNLQTDANRRVIDYICQE